MEDFILQRIDTRNLSLARAFPHKSTMVYNVTVGLLYASDIQNITNDNDLLMDSVDIRPLQITRFVVQRLLVPLVVCIGVVGNLISIAVLTHKSMKTSTNYYLTALAIFDSLYLMTSLVLSFKHYENLNDRHIYPYVYIISRVLSDMWANVSVCLTVTFTVERWVAVCHPMKRQIVCTPNRAKCIALTVSIIVIGCTSPEFKEWEVYGKTIGNDTVYNIRRTEFGQSNGYAVYFSWFLIIAFTFLPLVALCTFNFILIRTVYMASQLRRRMTYIAVNRSAERMAGEQNRITCMLVSVALVFIVCQLPTASMIIYSTYIEIKDLKLSAADINNLRIAGNVTNLCLSINAALNFVLYSAMSTKFRRVFMRRFCWWLPGHKMSRNFTDYSYISGMSFVKRPSTSRGLQVSRKDGLNAIKVCEKMDGSKNIHLKWPKCQPVKVQHSPKSISLKESHYMSLRMGQPNNACRDTTL